MEFLKLGMDPDDDDDSYDDEAERVLATLVASGYVKRADYTYDDAEHTVRHA